MLSPYRVLDLSDEEGILCGKILGDLGADVIAIEPPKGSPARLVGPFYHDEPDPEKSLFWFAYATSKRGITLDIETDDGRDIFKRLVKKTDIIVESFHPGYLESIGLGYDELEKVNPGVILVRITPFGQTGPYKDYKGPDIVVWGMGGQMAPFGEPDRPPFRISYYSQAYLNAGADGALTALLAIIQRASTGLGQQIDVSAHEAAVNCTEHITSGWDLRHAMQKRDGGTGQRLTRLWPCKDGYVSWFYWGGVMSLRTNVPLIKWMQEEGMADAFTVNYDWAHFGGPNTSQADIDHIEALTGKFFLAHTKDELFEGALKRNVQVYPVSTPADMLKDPQLIYRQFWVELEHPELGVKLPYPGAFAATDVAPPVPSRRAPLIGEHNMEVYEKELGITREQLVVLKEAGVI